MIPVKIVIGSNFGDEGKGLITDFISEKESVVVRFNGGVQAGHTVCADNIRHVFHHFGSGTLKGAKTYLSQFFIVNPILFRYEHHELGIKNIIPKIYIHPECNVTTPYDMMLNQIIEKSRSRKHGSCGLGIHETIERSKKIPLKLYNLLSEDHTRRVLMEIRSSYMYHRLKEEGIDFSPTVQDRFIVEWRKRVWDNGLIDRWIEDCKFFIENLSNDVTYHDDLFKEAKSIIFEGAQGLQLDEDNELNWPHVTHSKTGTHNVKMICENFGLDFENSELIYVTRPYFTRHGEGPLPRELINLIDVDVIDNTNISNEWQGSLRFAYLSKELLKETIDNDAQGKSYKLALTCLDQIRKGAILNAKKYDDPLDFANELFNYFKINSGYLSEGPNRKDVISF